MMFKNIRLWWKFEGRFYPRNFIQGNKNLFKWFKVVWKDRDWDHAYIFEVMEHKLTSQSNYIGSKDRHLSAKRDAEIMTLCVRLMERIREDYYSMEYGEYHKTDYWFEEIEDRPGLSTMESELIEENFDDYFKKYPLIYKRVMNGEGPIPLKDEINKEVIAINMGHINHNRAKRLLFKIMEENIEKWWD